MQKDQIHTLTETELANFPLEDFFDRYEQGLRSLLATFQQETKVCVERLEDLRSNVVKVLHHIEPVSVENFSPDTLEHPDLRYIFLNVVGRLIGVSKR
ncbi:MORC family CW-type zinc finger protein 2 [Fasciolopsis buskii]|uniref:MORC family CW-type zinc finger protein 2 n=1 Tax=Fasciolopsis buskii TaxID=27845 RepID=A0A8E0VM00_9TREM|nr:MORC family CW-type zinc finger protein 2 [Fasciolopsis buski]